MSCSQLVAVLNILPLHGQTCLESSCCIGRRVVVRGKPFAVLREFVYLASQHNLFVLSLVAFP